MTSKNLSAGAVVLFALLAVTPVCGGFFACGCDWPWQGLFVHCASLQGLRPGCPWCEHPLLGGTALVLPVLAGWTLVRRVLHRPQRERSAYPVPDVALAVTAGMLGVLASLAVLGTLTLLLLRSLDL